MKRRHIKLIALLVLFMLGGTGGLMANDIIQNKLPELKKDVRGYKLSPVVIYNKSNGKYETVYLKTDASGNLMVTTSAGAPINVAVSSTTSSIIATDDRFAVSVATHTGGKLNDTGTIDNTAFAVYNWAFYSDGGDSVITGVGGDIYALNGLGNSSPILHVPFESPTFTVTLPANTTFYYNIWGVKK